MIIVFNDLKSLEGIRILENVAAMTGEENNLGKIQVQWATTVYLFPVCLAIMEGSNYDFYNQNQVTR